MNRRTLLQYSATVAGLGLGLAGRALAIDCAVRRLPGAQLFTLRDALGADADAALGRLAATGTREVELYDLGPQSEVFGMSPQRFRTLLDKHGLHMRCAHFSGDTFDVPAIAANAHALGIDTAILAVAPGFISVGADGLRARGPQSREEMDGLADLLNSLGRQFRSEGLFFAYHNHHVEFLPVGEDIPYDYLMWNTDPQTVRAELDIGWLALAGADLDECMTRHGNRILSCHLKDFTGQRPADMGDFLAAAANLGPPGTGSIDFKRVLDWMDYYAIRHGFVEIDQSADPMADIAKGQQHLAGLRACDR